MKKLSLALAGFTVGASALAQSSITVFGVMDVSASRYSTRSEPVGAPTQKQRQWALSSGAYSGSRLGFRGTEDLGGGLAAGFWLELGLNGDSGGGAEANGTMSFNRRSTVSLSGGFGELRLGRDYVPTYLSDTLFDPFGGVGVGISTNASLGNARAGALLGAAVAGSAASLVLNRNYVRASNSIGYFLPPNLGGFYGQVMYGLNEQTKYTPAAAMPADTAFGGTQKSRAGGYVGSRIGYTRGNWNVALAYGESTVDDQFHAGTTLVQKMGNLATSYKIGETTLFGEYSNLRVRQQAEHPATVAPAAAIDAKFESYLLGVTVPLGAGQIRAAYSRTQGTIGTGPLFQREVAHLKAEKIALGYVHHLSKRTALYTTVAYVKNRDGMSFATGGTPGYAVSASRKAAAGRTDTGLGYEFGIRHAF
ncbi:putative porin [Variovorax boronicumulans]|uniref:porin n=1 Tax=Variovorax boronicumulans TaxID=436515 RepID=UPI002789522F|nr:porin [Variovorax boronicumulans]MDP9919036.1 putative porin [Variovorax boronicumulans]